MINFNGNEQLPQGWSKCGLSDISEVIMGQSPPSRTYNANEEGLPFFQGKAEFQSLYPNIRKFCSEPKKIAQKQAVLMSVRAPVGPTNLAPEKCCIGRGLAAFQPLGGISSLFMLYFFRSVERGLAIHGTGTTFSAINKQYIDELMLGVPPLKEQHRIVTKIEEFFSELDNGIKNLKTAREKLKVYREALLKHAFEGKLTEQWRKDNADKLETAEELLAQIKQEREARYQQQLAKWETLTKSWESGGQNGRKPAMPKSPPEIEKLRLEYEDIPSEWLYIKAKYISDFITKGTTPKKEDLYSGAGDVPFIKVYNLTKNGKLDFSIDPTFVSKKTNVEFLGRSRCFPGDVLMNIVGPPLGKVSVVPNTYPEWNINQAIVRYRTTFLNEKFLVNYFLSETVIRSISKKAKATAGQFNLTLEICREVLVPVCSADEQKQINDLLDEQLSIIDQTYADIETNLKKSEALRQSILKKAFSGQLVPQDPNDEPASVLLERIAAEKAAAEDKAKAEKAKAKRKSAKKKGKAA